LLQAVHTVVIKSDIYMKVLTYSHFNSSNYLIRLSEDATEQTEFTALRSS